MTSLAPAASLGNSTTQPSTFAAFFRECAVILVISYPILLFLLTVYPGVLPLATLPIFFLFGLTAVCTAVVSSLINLVVILTRRYYGYEESVSLAPSDVKIPVNIIIVEKA